jgi:hypothetical protein
MAHPRHAEVRQRYQRRCGYCGVSETETGGELTVDHYRPVTSGGDEADDNLVHCCFRCNTYKGDYWPTPADLQRGLHILHPLLDPVSQHLRQEEGTGRLEPLTPTGRFHIDLLRLNRPQLIDLRLTRRMGELLTEAWRLLREENEQLRLRVVLLEHYLGELHRRQTEGNGS